MMIIKTAMRDIHKGKAVRAALFAAVLVLLLSACGFRPMYGDLAADSAGSTVMYDAFSQVAVGNIPDREGQYLRNLLLDRLYVSGTPAAPAYKLSVGRIRERLRDLDITKSADATRGQLILRSRITLVDTQSGETVLDRDLRAVTSYNILSSQFTTRVSEENARKNALADLARQIETQLSLYFQRDRKDADR